MSYLDGIQPGNKNKTEITEEEAMSAKDAENRFFEKVREAYRELKAELTEEQLAYVFDDIHHVVNLYNPYLNS